MNYADLLRLRDFRNLWLGQAISQIGDAFYYVTFMFMVDKVTHNPAMVGYVGALETLPFLLLGPFAGVLADRVDRRRILLASDVLSGIVLLAFAISLLLQPVPSSGLLLLVPFALSCLRCFFMPTKNAAVPALVAEDRLTQANALGMATQNVVQMAGLGISAGVVSALWAISPKGFFLTSVGLNAISFFGSAYFIGRLPRLMPDREKAHESHPFTDLRDGLNYVRRRRDLGVLTLMMALFRLAVAPFFVIYIAANNAWFGGQPQTIIWFEASFFGGMLLASAYAPRVKVLHPTRWFCVALAFAGLMVAAMAFSPVFWLFILWNVLTGLAIPFGDIPIMTYLQTSVPDAFRGRVNALREMVATGVMPIGMVLAGGLLKSVGLMGAFLAIGFGMAVACLLGLFDREFRNARMPVSAHGEEVDGLAGIDPMQTPPLPDPEGGDRVPSLK